MSLVAPKLRVTKAKNRCQNTARATGYLPAPDICGAIEESYLVGATFGATAKNLFHLSHLGDRQWIQR
jgi:hypothetical protein